MVGGRLERVEFYKYDYIELRTREQIVFFVGEDSVLVPSSFCLCTSRNGGEIERKKKSVRTSDKVLLLIISLICCKQNLYPERNYMRRGGGGGEREK